MLPVDVRVIRDGTEREVLAEEMVPGDIVLLRGGDLVSADTRLVQESELRVDQSSLTGESRPVRRSAEPVISGEPKDLTFLGLAAMMDPPRPRAKEAVEMCRRAGIRIIMITGDYGLTAESIARRLGIARSSPIILTGLDLDAMDDIALKKAHIGVAMGVVGTDVAREAADVILTDDNLASIVNAVEEDRAVYANIKKFTSYIFTSNTPEAVPFILYAFSAGRIPLALNIMQIRSVDLVTDIVPALALCAEPPEPG